MTKAYLDAIPPLLSGLGLSKRAGDIYTIYLTAGVIGWLGLNRATKKLGPEATEINPVVGVRFQELERFVAECRSEKFHTFLPPTISTPLGYLMPARAYRAWTFTPVRVNETASDMVDAIGTYGIPFMHSVVDLDQLRLRLEDRMGPSDQLVYRRPAAAFLANATSEALAFLDNELAANGTRTDPAAAQFRSFADRLRIKLASA